MSIKDIIKKNKNPESFAVQKLLELEKEIKAQVEVFLSDAQKTVEELKTQVPKAHDIKSELSEHILGQKEILKLIADKKGDKGDSVKGDDGHTPTNVELLALITPLIPAKADDGKTPTPQELLALIKPLIPKVENGETPSDERLLALITPLIPKVENGKDGSPDTGDQIIGKINKSENKIDRERIEGLLEEIKLIKSLIRESKKAGGGGGMGNWVHERSAISSATTTITLASKIAANGMAHIARYNGQVQDLDTDYSVNGKVITLLFTPDDSTVFSIAYVRK